MGKYVTACYHERNRDVVEDRINGGILGYKDGIDAQWGTRREVEDMQNAMRLDRWKESRAEFIG